MSGEEISYDVESNQGDINISNQVSEKVSEELRESFKESRAKAKKTKYDEKKARKSDFMLTALIVKIILKKKYDTLLGQLFALTKKGVASNFILGALSLIHIETSNQIRKISKKEKIVFSFCAQQQQRFDDSNLPDEIKQRINYWVEDMIDIICMEYSSITTKKLLTQIKENDNITNFCMCIFSFFLHEANIIITPQKSRNIIEFILSEVEKKLSKLEIEEI